MLTFIDFVLPLVLIILIMVPLLKAFNGKQQKATVKKALSKHVAGFFTVVALIFVVQLFVKPQLLGAEEVAPAADLLTGTLAQGLGFISAALATGLSALGAGIAVAAAAPAAIGAFSENEKNFGKSLIFVALGEGVAIYGLLISILIINQL
jgi:V/A-type H+-transporting ATPase subunit K